MHYAPSLSAKSLAAIGADGYAFVALFADGEVAGGVSDVQHTWNIHKTQKIKNSISFFVHYYSYVRMVDCFVMRIGWSITVSDFD